MPTKCDTRDMVKYGVQGTSLVHCDWFRRAKLEAGMLSASVVANYVAHICGIARKIELVSRSILRLSLYDVCNPASIEHVSRKVASIGTGLALCCH